jgi:hypothetical protein
MAAVINKYPERFLLVPTSCATTQEKYLKVFNMYAPLLAELTPDAKNKLLKGNYERLFDARRAKVRAWEKAHANDLCNSGAYTFVWCCEIGCLDHDL